MTARFSLGRLLITPGAQQLLEESGVNPLSLILRHLALDSEIDAHDHAMNRQALVDGSRILNAYTVGGVRVYLITEAQDDDGNRAATTILKASEY